MMGKYTWMSLCVLFAIMVFVAEASPAKKNKKNKKNKKVNGGYSPWTEYTECDKKCGGGYQTRSRTCNNPKPANGGRKCRGKSTGRRKCNRKKCPKPPKVHGGYSEWSKFSVCDKKCGGGYQNRSRHCNDPNPSNGGKDCRGKSTERRKCNKEKCPKPPKVHGGYSEWSEYSVCDKECGGGSQSRSRTCDNPNPENGGRECRGKQTVSRKCNKQKCRTEAPATAGPPTKPVPTTRNPGDATMGPLPGSTANPRACNFNKRCNMKRNFNAVGCFSQWYKPLSNAKMLDNFRSEIPWTTSPKFSKFICERICDCARKASEQDYDFFSIRYWGECMGGKDLSGGTRSKRCAKIDGTFEYCNGGQECVGKGHGDFLYQFA